MLFTLLPLQFWITIQLVLFKKLKEVGVIFTPQHGCLTVILQQQKLKTRLFVSLLLERLQNRLTAIGALYNEL